MNYLFFAAILLSEATEPVGVPGWVPVVIGLILLLLFWWGLNRNSIPEGAASHADDSHHDDHAPQMHSEPHGAHMEPEPAETVTAVATDPAPTGTKSISPPDLSEPDDLKIVEGIGPKIEGILHDAGIRTFAELAAASVTQLEKIVREDAGIRVAFPDTWPEQAQLAATSNWGKLEQLQDELKGGRRE